MLSTELEYLWTELECYVHGWNAFYRVEMISTGLEWFLQGRNAFDRVGTPSSRVGMLSTVFENICTGLECSR
jgi:hypothetical protein